MNKELIDAVLKHDDQAYHILLDQYKPMIYHIIHRFSLEYGDYAISMEDLYQEGCIGLLEACRRYKEGYDASFTTFAYTIIKRQIQRFLFQSLRRYKHEGYSIDCKDRYEDYASQFESKRISENPVLYFENKAKLDQVCTYISTLNKEDQMIVKMRENNASYLEISKALNISKKRIDNRLQLMKKGYQKYIKDQK